MTLREEITISSLFSYRYGGNNVYSSSFIKSVKTA